MAVTFDEIGADGISVDEDVVLNDFHKIKKSAGALELLSILLCLIMFDNVRNRTIEDVAEHIECLCSDGFSLFHAVDGIGGNTVLKNQFIFCHIFAK